MTSHGNDVKCPGTLQRLPACRASLRPQRNLASLKRSARLVTLPGLLLAGALLVGGWSAALSSAWGQPAADGARELSGQGKAVQKRGGVEPQASAMPWTILPVLKDDATTLPYTAGEQAVRLRIRVQVAANDAARMRGLMFRRQPLADDEGMLFLWPRPQPVAMWMKNTFISLDMVFIDADGMVVRVHENARPHDLTPIPSGVPVKAVLELAAGAAARLGLRPGVMVRLPAMKVR